MSLHRFFPSPTEPFIIREVVSEPLKNNPYHTHRVHVYVYWVYW